MNFQVIIGRLLRLARFDFSVFDEVKGDATATVSGVTVVAAATLLTGLGSWLWVLFNVDDDARGILDLEAGDVFLKSVIVGGILQVGLWAAWVAITYLLLTGMFKLKADVYKLLGVMGYAFAPMALTILFFIPVLDMPIGIFALGATATLSYIAIVASTGASPRQALLANLAGFAVFLIVLGVLGNDSTNLAPGIFLLDIEGV